LLLASAGDSINNYIRVYNSCTAVWITCLWAQKPGGREETKDDIVIKEHETLYCASYHLITSFTEVIWYVN
jgi:hypothetical protein